MAEAMKLIRDCIAFAWCWWCWRIVVSPVPLTWTHRLLPCAGMYAYSETWADFREVVAWNWAGKPDDWEWRRG